jgi:hypothetical protein
MALVCKIELSQTDGITVTVINKDGKITQTMVFNGTSMVHTCKGENDTSTITQTSDTITVQCKNFNVNAETITCKSTKNTLHHADGTFDIDSTEKSTFNSAVDMDIKAATKLNINATDFVTTATNSAKVTAMTTTLNGDTKAEVTGTQVDLAATAAANLKGASVKVAATGLMNIEGGGITTVKGSITNIQGNLVKLG